MRTLEESLPISFWITKSATVFRVGKRLAARILGGGTTLGCPKRKPKVPVAGGDPTGRGGLGLEGPPFLKTYPKSVFHGRFFTGGAGGTRVAG